MTGIVLTFAIVAGVVVMAAPAHAYLDPGTGSMMLQVLLGGVAGVAVVLKLYWKKVKALFGGPSAAEPGAENEQLPE